MPIYVRIGMHLLYSEYDTHLLGIKRIRDLLKEQSIACALLPQQLRWIKAYAHITQSRQGF